MLQWSKTSPYCITSTCGRFTVSKVIVQSAIHYIAWRKPYTELGATRLPGTASDEQRQAAIREMQSVCEAAQEEQAA